MDRRIQEFVEYTKEKFGLENYYLERHRLSRNVDLFNHTVYTLCMEWFPQHVTGAEEDGSNPEGSAVIEIDVHTRMVTSAIFVRGKTYAKGGIVFTDLDLNGIIKWIERETGLVAGKQFQLHKEEEGRLLFKGCMDGVAVFPSGGIEVQFNQARELTFFAVHGHFPAGESVRKEAYTLSFEKVEKLTKEQLKLLEFPSFELGKLFPVYAVEEIFVKNDDHSTIPFEVIADVGAYMKIDQTIFWDEPSHEPFMKAEINWNEEITVEQAFANEPSPDSVSISEEEKEKCVLAVKDLLRKEYPKDTGRWVLKTIHRDKGDLQAIVRLKQEDDRVFKRKLLVMIDAETLQAVNYLDNGEMLLDIFDSFQAPGDVLITKAEAFEKLKGLYELKPYYVYDFAGKQYVLCGKLDCLYGVNAISGEPVLLSDLR